MPKWASYKRLKRIADKYSIPRRWLFDIGGNTITFSTVRKLATMLLLRELGAPTRTVSFARNDVVLSPAAISAITGGLVNASWCYYNQLLSMPLWRWRMRLRRFPLKGKRDAVLSALAEFGRKIEDLAQEMWNELCQANKTLKERR